MIEVVVVELNDEFPTQEAGRLAVEKALEKNGVLAVELPEDDVVVVRISDSRDALEEVTEAVSQAGIKAYIFLGEEGKYGGKAKPEKNAILPVYVTAPAGSKPEEVARLLNQLIAVGQADASESADDEDIDNPDAAAAAALEAEVKPQLYLVINTINGKCGPAVTQVEQFTDEQAALTLAVRLAREQEAPENDEQVRKELEENGSYYPVNYSEWAVTLIHL